MSPLRGGPSFLRRKGQSRSRWHGFASPVLAGEPLGLLGVGLQESSLRLYLRRRRHDDVYSDPGLGAHQRSDGQEEQNDESAHRVSSVNFGIGLSKGEAGKARLSLQQESQAQLARLRQ